MPNFKTYISTKHAQQEAAWWKEYQAHGGKLGFTAWQEKRLEVECDHACEDGDAECGCQFGAAFKESLQ